MRYRLFGQTGLRVSEFFLGGTSFFTRGDAAQQQKHHRLLERYAEAGGNVIDTASAYGESEEVVGELLAGQRDQFVVATKYTLSRDAADPNAAGNHRKNLRLSVEQSLRRLRTDYLDVLWVHIWDRHTPVAETMRALDDAVRAGKVLYVGLSDSPAWLTAQANTLAQWHGWTPFAGIQVPYNLLQRDIERELLPMAGALGLSVASWRPLARGRLTGRADPAQQQPSEQEERVLTALRQVAEELDATMAQVAIAWTRSRSPAVHPILAASDTSQLMENLGAGQLRLPEPAQSRLTAATSFEAGFPADFLAECEPDPWVFGSAAATTDGWPGR